MVSPLIHSRYLSSPASTGSASSSGTLYGCSSVNAVAQRLESRRARLEHDDDLVLVGDLALPAVERPRTREHRAAGDQPALEQRPNETTRPPRRRPSWSGRRWRLCARFETAKGENVTEWGVARLRLMPLPCGLAPQSSQSGHPPAPNRHPATCIRAVPTAAFAGYGRRFADRSRRARAQPPQHRRDDPARPPDGRHRACRARGNPRSRSTRSTPRGSGDTSSRCPRTRGSSSG